MLMQAAAAAAAAAEDPWAFIVPSSSSSSSMGGLGGAYDWVYLLNAINIIRDRLTAKAYFQQPAQLAAAPALPGGCAAAACTQQCEWQRDSCAGRSLMVLGRCWQQLMRLLWLQCRAWCLAPGCRVCCCDGAPTVVGLGHVYVCSSRSALSLPCQVYCPCPLSQWPVSEWPSSCKLR